MREETILAFDFGEKRIGVAVGNTVTRTATALTTLEVESNADRLNAVATLVKEWQPARFVIGEPRHEDGAPHPVAHLAKKFGNRLRENFRLPVEFEDESLSSVAAAEALDRQGVFGEKRRGRLDAAAAQVILQRYLDHWAADAA
ncbi:MAG: Holliday junction resolvase RuvX [Betaproteobacteria bacterium]|nr:Holliday junction resolvase RuvX [Betaproteobacteria bacterium]